MRLSEAGCGVCGTHVTWSDIETKMQNSFDTNATFGEGKSVEAIGEGMGFLSRMCLIKPNWQNGSEVLPKVFLAKISSFLTLMDVSRNTDVLKAVSSDAALESLEERFRVLHNAEIQSYRIFEKYCKGQLPIPKVYSSVAFSDSNRGKGFLLLEFIENSHVRHFGDDLSRDQLKQIIPFIVKLQSLKVDAEDTASFIKNPFRENMKEFFKQSMVDSFLKEMSSLAGGFFSSLGAELKILCDDVINGKSFEQLDRLNETLGMRDVIVHGDLWAANLLWENNDSSKLKAIVDFQATKYGNSALDLQRVMLQMNHVERREETEKILEEFYSNLKAELKQEMPYTLEQLKSSFDLLFPFMAVYTACGLGAFMAYVQKNSTPQVMGNFLQKVKAMLEDAIEINKKQKKRN